MNRRAFFSALLAAPAVAVAKPEPPPVVFTVRVPSKDDIGRAVREALEAYQGCDDVPLATGCTYEDVTS